MKKSNGSCAVVNLVDQVRADVFPEPIMEILQEISTATGASLDMCMVGLLGMVSGCIGKGIFYESKQGYRIAGNIFIALVAGSGCNKTGALRPFMAAVEKFQKKTGTIIKVKDFTEAGLRDMFNGADRGILGHFNELSGLFSLVRTKPQYKETLIDCYDVTDWVCLRAGKEIFINDACLSIVGTIQPKVYIEAVRRMGYHDGFLPRFLPVLVPLNQELPAWNERGISAKTTERLDALVSYSVNICEFFGEQPVVLKPTPEARKAYSDWLPEMGVDNYHSFRYVINVISIAILSK